jgi:DNA polymerase-3 subunit delta'
VAADDNAVSARIEVQEYPWHADLWNTIAQDLTRMHHALLLHGQAGLGKEAFALRLARAALCNDRQGVDACGTCRSCALFAAGTHPDFLYVRPQDDSDSILVDQIRPVTEFFSLKAHISPRKVVVVSPADTMNVSAANSLLKILEEPPAGSMLMLVATQLARMAATVRSRCMRLTLSPPPRDAARAWLANIRSYVRSAGKP